MPSRKRRQPSRSRRSRRRSRSFRGTVETKETDRYEVLSDLSLAGLNDKVAARLTGRKKNERIFLLGGLSTDGGINGTMHYQTLLVR